MEKRIIIKIDNDEVSYVLATKGVDVLRLPQFKISYKQMLEEVTSEINYYYIPFQNHSIESVIDTSGNIIYGGVGIKEKAKYYELDKFRNKNIVFVL